MPLKSKINIEVQSRDFEASYNLFKKYQDALKDMPGIWGFYGTQINNVAKAADKVTSFYEEQTASITTAAYHHSRFSDAATKAGTAFSKLASSAKHSAGHLASIAFSLFKISLIGFVSGISGSGFGVYLLDRAAMQVMERRRSALSLGLGYGQLQSFNTNFSRFGIGQEALGASATGIYDVTSPEYRGLYGAGLGGSKNAGSAMVSLLRRLPQIFAGVSPGMIGPTAHSFGIDQLLSLTQIVAFLSASDSEREQQLKAYEADNVALNIPPEVAEKWADFSTVMTSAGISIKSILADKLSGLTDPLVHISETMVNIITAFANSKVADDGIAKVQEGLEWFADKIGSEEAKEWGKVFLSGMAGLNKMIGSLIPFMGKLAKLGINTYRLFDDPNYNPTWADVGAAIGETVRSAVAPYGPMAQEPTPAENDKSRGQSHHPYPSIRWGTGGGGPMAPKDRAPPSPYMKPSVTAPAPSESSPASVPPPSDQPPRPGMLWYPKAGSWVYPPAYTKKELEDFGEPAPYPKKSSMLNNLRGARTPHAIVMNNESSANVSARRIPIAT